MTISLPSDLQPFVDELVATGAYPTAEAVVSEALRLMRDDQMKFELLKESFDGAIEELETTGGTPLDFKEIKRKARARLAVERLSNLQ